MAGRLGGVTAGRTKSIANSVKMFGIAVAPHFLGVVGGEVSAGFEGGGAGRLGGGTATSFRPPSLGGAVSRRSLGIAGPLISWAFLALIRAGSAVLCPFWALPGELASSIALPSS